MSSSPHAAPKRTALILSGGGARGAYEVGVLWYVFDELARLRGKSPRVDIISGTSVGAINGCYLASHLDDTSQGLRRLVSMWSELEFTKVVRFGPKQLWSIPKLLTGGTRETGFFNAEPLAELVAREIRWRSVARSIRNRALHGLTVSTTEVATGRTVVFMQTSPDVALPAAAPPRTLFRADHIGPTHALASAAIPLVFPPVRIDGSLYIDGGLRQNTPIAPALRLGASHILAVGSSREVRGVVVSEDSHEAARVPGAAFLLGKVLNAFLLDHIDVDIELLSRINQVLADGTSVYGNEFTSKINELVKRRGGMPYSPVSSLAVRPSEDLGRLAAAHVRRGKFLGNPMFVKQILNLLDVGAGDESDLASYLLFDGTFCRTLIELGRSDAHARRHEILAFFEDAESDRPQVEELPPADRQKYPSVPPPSSLPTFPKIGS